MAREPSACPNCEGGGCTSCLGDEPIRAMATGYEAAAQEFFDAAVEIAEDYPSITTCSFEDFCMVMWHDDYDMRRFGLDRETMLLALQSAWEKTRG
jgi:hypothetical protein